MSERKWETSNESWYFCLYTISIFSFQQFSVTSNLVLRRVTIPVSSTLVYMSLLRCLTKNFCNITAARVTGTDMISVRAAVVTVELNVRKQQEGSNCESSVKVRKSFKVILRRIHITLTILNHYGGNHGDSNGERKVEMLGKLFTFLNALAITRYQLLIPKFSPHDGKSISKHRA